MSIFGNPVMMGGSGGGTIDPLTVTQNGTYTPSGTTLGYGPVVVNVQGGDDPFALTQYIESTGTQYIDTGYYASSTSRFELVFESSDTTHSYAVPFGTRATGNDNAASLSALFALSWNNSKLNAMWGSGSVALTPRENYVGKKAVCELSAEGFKITTKTIFCVGTTLNSLYTPTDQYPMWLFNLNDHGGDYGTATHCAMKLYRFRIYESEVLVHEFLPWQESGVACLKDSKTGTLKYNAGSGSFTYGEDQ